MQHLAFHICHPILLPYQALNHYMHQRNQLSLGLKILLSPWGYQPIIAFRLFCLCESHQLQFPYMSNQIQVTSAYLLQQLAIAIQDNHLCVSSDCSAIRIQLLFRLLHISFSYILIFKFYQFINIKITISSLAYNFIPQHWRQPITRTLYR